MPHIFAQMLLHSLQQNGYLVYLKGALKNQQKYLKNGTKFYMYHLSTATEVRLYGYCPMKMSFFERTYA